MTHNQFRVVFLCSNCLSTRVLYHVLSQDWDIIKIIVEEKPTLRQMLLRRVRRLGWKVVLGQVLFMSINLIILKLLQPQIHALLIKYKLCDDNIPSEWVKNVSSVNNSETISLLTQMKPDVVVVNGTRILSTEVLESITAPFINTHMGITPLYRGIHGGYWSLVNDDIEHCGVTVHLVDKGIDTGGVLYQNVIKISASDSFNTYPIHQINAAIPLMHAALTDIKNNKIKVKCINLPSRLWSHPTLGQYLQNWLRKGVK